jgi:hypothetical protein
MYTLISYIINGGVKAVEPLPDPTPFYIYVQVKWWLHTIYIYETRKEVAS